MNDSNEYYVIAHDKKKVIGPVTLTQITTALKEGKLKPTHIASLSLNGPWQSLEEMFASGSKNLPKTDDSSSTVKTKKRLSVLHIPRLCFRFLAFIPGLRLWCRFWFKTMLLCDVVWSVFLFPFLGLSVFYLLKDTSVGGYSEIRDPFVYLSTLLFYGFAFAAPLLEGKSCDELNVEMLGEKAKVRMIGETSFLGVLFGMFVSVGACLFIVGLLIGGWQLNQAWTDSLIEKSKRAKEREIEIIKEGVKRALEESK